VAAPSPWTTTIHALQQAGEPKAIRLWAQEQGLEISNRGRIPAEIIDRYRAADGG